MTLSFGPNIGEFDGFTRGDQRVVGAFASMNLAHSTWNQGKVSAWRRRAESELNAIVPRTTAKVECDTSWPRTIWKRDACLTVHQAKDRSAVPGISQMVVATIPSP
jgi:hypothetical protein